MAARRGVNCDKCGRHFRDTHDLKKHKTRKTPCVPILDESDLPIEKKASPNKCKFCGRAFMHATSVLRHIKQNCKIAPRNGDTSGMEKLYEHTLKRQEQEMLKMKEKMKLLEESNIRLLALSEGRVLAAPRAVAMSVAPRAIAAEKKISGATVGINNGTIMVDQSTNVQNISINIFGSEKVDHITRGSIKQLFDSIMGRGGADLKDLLPAAQMAVVQATLLIYSDEKHPENITCYLPNKKANDVLVHGETGWEVRPYKMVVSPMAARAINVLFDKQPLPGEDGIDETADIDQCGKVLRCLADNETELTIKPPTELRPVLIRNKDILAKYLAKLPVAGME